MDILRRRRDREYAFRNLQFQYAFPIRDYTHTEKVFESRTQMKQFICSSPLNKNKPPRGYFVRAEAVRFELTVPVKVRRFSKPLI